MQREHMMFLLRQDPRSNTEPRYTLAELQEVHFDGFCEGMDSFKQEVPYAAAAGGLAAFLITPTVLSVVNDPVFSMMIVGGLSIIAGMIQSKISLSLREWLMNKTNNQ